MVTVKKHMIRGLILVLGVAILFSALAQAQPQRMSVEDRVKMLKDSLKLSDDQSAKITKILEDQREEMTTAMKDIRDNRDSMQTIRQEIMKKTNEQIKSVLTESQTKKYDAMLKNRRQNMGRRASRSSQ
jgi:periplasmic protein CpxP/Spy